MRTRGCSSASARPAAAGRPGRPGRPGRAPRWPAAAGPRAARGPARRRRDRSAARPARPGRPAGRAASPPSPKPTTGPNAGSSTTSTTQATPGGAIGWTDTAGPNRAAISASTPGRDGVGASARSSRTAPRSSRCRRAASARLQRDRVAELAGRGDRRLAESTASRGRAPGCRTRPAVPRAGAVPRPPPPGPAHVHIGQYGRVPAGSRRQAAYRATRPSARTASSTDGYVGTPAGSAPDRGSVATDGLGQHRLAAARAAVDAGRLVDHVDSGQRRREDDHHASTPSSSDRAAASAAANAAGPALRRRGSRG